MIEYYEKCMRRTNKYLKRLLIRKIMFFAQISKN